MTSAFLTSEVSGVDSSPAISAPQQKEKIRMQAQRYQRGSLTVQKRKSQGASRNRITSVRTSSKRLKEPEILTDEEFQALIAELEPRERVMIMLDGSTGLRRGELIALRWRDVDFKLNQAFVTHSVWRSVEGDCKTAASRRPVPLHPIVIAELIGWREASLYRSEDDFLFPSVQKNGTQPLQPDMILKRHIRPALGRIGCTKRIGWHSFRHGLATLLRQKKVDVKTSQELMRHANSRIMIDFYQQAVTEEKRAGQALACAGLFAAVGASAPSAP